ncbi:MAG: rod shape-determining protein MreC [Deltaproteobacteria bacterium]|nr:MAG: rod shape-determining protein MreC [Deltaproteobacteria bacterium]
MTAFFERKPKWISYVFVFIALILLSLSIGRGPEWNPAEKVVAQIAAPFQKFFVGTIRTVRDIWAKYFYLVETHQENVLLKRKLDRLRLENSRYQELLLTNRRLQELLNFQENTDELLLPARVIGWDSSGLFKSITIDKGDHDGVTVSMPVVNAEGVVGRIISVSPGYAQVLLVTDRNSSVDGLVQRSRGRGILKGRGSSECLFEYVIKTCDIKNGDTIVTSGMGGVFPKGLYLGTVIQIEDSPNKLFKDVRVVPAVDFSKLEEVLVVSRSGVVSLPNPEH